MIKNIINIDKYGFQPITRNYYDITGFILYQFNLFKEDFLLDELFSIENTEDKKKKINESLIPLISTKKNGEENDLFNSEEGIVLEEYNDQKEYNNVMAVFDETKRHYYEPLISTELTKIIVSDKTKYIMYCSFNEEWLVKMISNNKYIKSPIHYIPMKYQVTYKDLSCKLNEIREELLNSFRRNNLKELLRDYYHLRHNALLSICCYMLSIPFQEDVPIEDTNLTPDIFEIYEEEKIILIGDISITITPSLMVKKKKDKYMLIKEDNKYKDYKFIDCYICLKPDISNVENAFKEPLIKYKRDLPLIDLNEIMDWFNNFRTNIIDKYSREEVDKQIFKEFNNLKDIIDVKYEDLFQKDLNIDINNWEEFYVPEELNTNEIADHFKEVLKNEEIFSKYKPKKLTKEDILESNDFLIKENNKMNTYPIDKPKPSFHLMAPFFDKVNVPNMFCLHNMRTEQTQIYKMCFSILRNMKEINTDKMLFLKEICKNYVDCCDDSKIQRSINDEGEIFLKKYTEEYHENVKKTRNISKLDYLRKNNEDFREFPTDEHSYFTGQKMIRIPKNKWSSEFKNVWMKAGNNYSKYHEKREKLYVVGNDGPKLKKDKIEKSVDLNVSEEVTSNFIDYLSEQTIHSQEISETLLKDNICDDQNCNKLRKLFVKDYKPILEEVMNTKAHLFLKNSSMIYDELLHYNGFSLADNKFAIFTAGIPNFFTIISMSRGDKGKDVGKSYISCGYGPSEEIYNYKNMFGNVYCFPIEDNPDICFYMTNWRRMPGTKLTFLRDSYYSVLSSGCISLMRDNITGPDFKEQLKRKYILRGLISQCTSQRLAEVLMDMRYYQVALFSMYTNIKELVIDKFSPPYRCYFIGFIINRILRSDYFFTEIRKPNSFVAKRVVMDETGLRNDSSVGFKRIRLPSFFGYGMIKNEQDLLDDLFCYVHTMKEPSSMFHEQVGAIRTIYEFQKKYDNLDPLLKDGKAKTKNDFISFFKKRNKMGFMSAVIKDASELFINKIKPNIKKIITRVNEETIANITSTKSVIDKGKRTVISLFDEDLPPSMYKRREKIIQERIDQFGDESIIKNAMREVIRKYKSNFTKGKEEDKKFGKMRLKVHDSIRRLLDEYDQEDKDCFKNVDFVNEFLKEDPEILADICIKAQYGSKREFYVMNIIGKIYTRIFENIFRELCQLSGTEMISVAGDEKILKMQTILNDSLNYAIENDMKIVYINGDCTKWSASEIMQSFASMIIGFKNVLPKNCYNYLLFVTKKWCEKKIQVPQEIIQKVFPVVEGTEYLKYLDDDKCLKSTHNFLQGVFNYCSSLKAVICAEYTQEIFERIYPGNKTKYFHMEHSDDYAGVLCYEEDKDLELYKTLHSMMMASCSMTDSDKKTTIQTVMFEFVSLIGFNGSMTYPSIKKTKEVGTNVACVGYTQDMANIGTRTAELLRIGLPQSCCYLFNRIHNLCIRNAYSVLPGMRNDPEETWELDSSEIPVELFGETNMVPCFYLLCKGDPNNYRLKKYGRKYVKNLLRKLVHSPHLRNTSLDEESGEYDVWSPYYMFSFENNLIKVIRDNLDLTKEEAEKYWEKYITYNFYKPNNKEDFKLWLKAMYYKKSFSLAYNRISRLQMSIRISRFSSKSVIKINEDDDFMTMNECAKTLKELLDKENVGEYKKHDILTDNLLLKGDDTCRIMYDWYTRVSINCYDYLNKVNTVATRLPYRITQIPIDNNPGNVLEYLYDSEIFHKNNRKPINISSIENDVNTLRKFFPGYCEIIKNDNYPFSTRLRVTQTIYTIMSLTKAKRNVCMMTSKRSSSVNDFLIAYNNKLLSYNHKANIKILPQLMIKDMYTLRLSAYDNLKHNINPDLAIISSMAMLLGNLFYLEKMSMEAIQTVFEHVYVNKKYSTINCKEYLENIDHKYIESVAPRNSYIAQYCFLKYYILLDHRALTYLANKVNGYQYKYTLPQKRDNKGNWYGDCELVLRTFDRTSIFTIKNNKINMKTEHDNPQRALFTFIIGLEKTQYKKQKDIFEKRVINIEELRPYINYEENSGLKLSWDKRNQIFNFTRLSTESLPVYSVKSLGKKYNFNIGRIDFYNVKVKRNDLVVQIGGYNFFRLPLLSTNYYPVLSSDNVLTNEIKLNNLLKLDLKDLLLDKMEFTDINDFYELFDHDYLDDRILEENNLPVIITKDDKIIYNSNLNRPSFSKKPTIEREYIKEIPLKTAYKQGRITKEEYRTFMLQDYQIKITDKDIPSKLKTNVEDKINVIKTDDYGSQISESKESVVTADDIRSKINVTEISENFMTVDFDEDIELEEEALDEGVSIELEKGIVVNKESRVFKQSAKEKAANRIFKADRPISFRIMFKILLGDMRYTERTIFHDSLMEVLEKRGFFDDEKKETLLTFYNNIVKETLPIKQYKESTENCIFLQYPSGETEFYVKRKSKRSYNVKDSLNILKRKYENKEKAATIDGEIVNISSTIGTLRTMKRAGKLWSYLDVFIKNEESMENNKLLVEYFLKGNTKITNTINSSLYNEIKQELYSLANVFNEMESVGIL